MKNLFNKNDNAKVINFKSVETKAKIKKIRDKSIEVIGDVAKAAVGTIIGIAVVSQINKKDNSEA